MPIIAAICVSACTAGDVEPAPVDPAPGFVGSPACEECHRPEFDLWLGSHHQLAMQPATPDTVLGDFSGVTVPYYETQATMSARDGRFFVVTENGDNEQQEYEITHAFGVYPLQQYLVDAPRGRKQALQYAWDSRPAADGGQRWYHLYPGEPIEPGDPLHWTGRYFNWNYMCAECHSTNLELGYDVDSDSFDTTFSEISVGCEACHGPGSRHVAQAGAAAFDEAWGLVIDLDDRGGGAWVMDPGTGIARLSSDAASPQQPEACGRCHSRRRPVTPNYEYGKPLADTHLPTLLEEDLYHADGRILDEVYVYGSFIQSRMYAAGVTCSDCHDAHSGELRAGPNPNDTCGTCHLATVFATAEHGGESSGDCVSCHMPARTYMGVDDRRDHSFRLPGTANDDEHYGAIIAAGRKGGANDELLRGIVDETYPPIARATMLTLLGPLRNAADRSILQRQLDDADPLVRVGALRALAGQPPQLRMEYGSHLLRDPVRSVRVEAAATYVDDRDLLPLEDSRAFPAAADDFRDAMRAVSAMPDAALNLAEFETRLGNTGAAQAMYEHAFRIGADLAGIQHGYGLYLVRSGRAAEALDHLRRATELEPRASRFVYVYGVALNSLGRPQEALGVLERAYDRFPEDFDIGWALATIYRDMGERESARTVLAGLEERFPGNASIRALSESLTP